MIDFTNIKLYVSQFDTDLLAQVVDATTGDTKYENIPCHFVIRQIDAAPAGGTVSAGYMPIIVAGEVYTSEPLDISDKDSVTVYKRDKAGNVLAAYEGQTGTIAVRGARSVFTVTLSKVNPPLPPKPIETTLWYFDDGKRPRTETTKPIECVKTEIDNSQALLLVDPALVYVDKQHTYFPDPENGDVYICPGSTFWPDGSTRDDGTMVFMYPKQLDDGTLCVAF